MNIEDSKSKSISESSGLKSPSKHGLDEDGFRARAKNKKMDNDDSGNEEMNGKETSNNDNKKISSYSALSKDVQFLLKVKRYRREKENEDSGRQNGF